MSEQSVRPRPDAGQPSTKSHGTLVCWFIVLTMFVVVCTLHFRKLGTAPKGFFVDECSIAYNAYCIARTGADEYGTSWPIFFRSLDTYDDPADVYSAVPPMRAVGLEKWAARLPCGLYSLLACVAFSLLLRHWRFEAPIAVAGGFLLSVIPWVFPLSRNCSFAGHIAALLGLVAGLALTGSAWRRQSTWRAVLAGAVWAFTFYTHQSFLPVLALLAIGCAIVLCRPLMRQWRLIVVMMLSALVVLLPLIISVLRFPQGLTARFQQVGVSSEPAPLTGLITGVGSRYLDYFSPRFLLLSGDSNLRHHTGHGGELYWCLAPLILAGLYVTIRYWRQHASHRIILVGILVSPVAAALTVDRMHSTRCVYAVIFWLLLAMVGAQTLWRHRSVGRKLLAVACVAGLIESSVYFADYFGAYQTRSAAAFQPAVTEALEYCFDHVSSNQTLYVENSMGAACNAFIHPDFRPYLYAYLLFFGRIDPWSYQHGGFSNTVIRPWYGHIDQPGLFLRCNLAPVPIGPTSYQGTAERTPVLISPNAEAVPSGAKLLATFPDVAFANQEYQVYAVK